MKQISIKVKNIYYVNTALIEDCLILHTLHTIQRQSGFASEDADVAGEKCFKVDKFR